MSAKDSREFVFDGTNVTAMTSEISATLEISGRAVSTADFGRFLMIRGGTNFIIGPYMIVATDSGPNTWTLDRPCTTGAGAGMTGKFVNPEGSWHKPVLEYYERDLPNNPGKGQARQAVLKALNLIEPRVLKSLARTCLRRELLEPEAVDIHDWCSPVEFLLWGHLPAPAENDSADKTVYLENLKPLREAIVRWAKDKRRKRWNLSDSTGGPLEWVAEAAVQTLVWWYAHKKGKLPKTLVWENLDAHCYRSLDSEEAWEMFELERDFDAGSGYVRVAPEEGVDASRLPARAQRVAKQQYKSLGANLDLARMQILSERHVKWYVQQTFLGYKLREIRKADPNPPGYPGDDGAVTAIAHGIAKVARLVGFRR